MFPVIQPMNPNPLISVCIITYNQEKFIEKCLQGTTQQKTDFSYEIVIGEDHSTDKTASICTQYLQTYPELIKLHRRQENLGMIENWIQTLRSCSGKYVAVCEGDDYWTDPLKLQKQVSFLETHPEFSICFHKVMLLQGSKLTDDWITNPPKDESDIYDLIEHRNYIHTPSVVFRNNIQLPPPYFYSPVADYFLYMLLTQDGSKIKYMNEVMAVYRYGVGVYGTTTDNVQLWNWYNTLFLIQSCISDTHKKALGKAISKIKLLLESYASQHITTATYLSQKVTVAVLVKAIRMKIRHTLKKRMR